MLDLKLIRENPQLVRRNLERRQDPNYIAMFDELLVVDKKVRELTAKVNSLRARRNELSLAIANAKKTGADISAVRKEAELLPEQIKTAEAELETVQQRLTWLHMRLPNMLHDSVPFGKDEHDNVEIRKWGKPPKFKFEPKGHLELALTNGWIDSERANKVSGHGFFYLKGPLVLLDFAILCYAMDFLVRRKYLPIEPPFMIHRKPYEGVTDLADFENVMYKIENDDLYLIATSEHAMGAMYMDETLDIKDLPIKFVGISPCFRREVGAHGKYTKGLFRMHQFNKVEQFIFCHPDESWKLHEELQTNAEKLYQGLGLHYRVVNVCTGDIGIIAAKKYDIEVWMADGNFREIGSNSNCTDYQARRLNIKYRLKTGQPPAGFVHTLNNTALATSRTMMAILEQHQQKDGSVKIPTPLQKWMGGLKKLEPLKK
ncbi:MAG: serine--tRNA ligase [Candidatus Aenigmatarchaeota archaeon]